MFRVLGWNYVFKKKEREILQPREKSHGRRWVETEVPPALTPSPFSPMKRSLRNTGQGRAQFKDALGMGSLQVRAQRVFDLGTEVGQDQKACTQPLKVKVPSANS